MNFFDIVLSPFIFIIKQVFLFSYSITNDYGISIVLLSFAVSLLLLPIFILIEKAKKKDDAIKLKMKPRLDEIKRCYKGQERYYYLKTLNRQFHYNPIKSLIPVLSLLLQIPFFIAAYQFLDGFEPLQGVSFLFINDLSLPDALFGAVNFLPIAMTLVNLLTAYFYTRNGDASERKQMLMVAGIFLVLLFNLPSGLVLYWTMNNVFSFLRLFITNPEVFRKRTHAKSRKGVFVKNFVFRFKATRPKWKATFVFLLLVAVLLQFNWAFQNNFNDIFQRLVFATVGSFLSMVFLVALASVHKIDWSGKYNGLKELFFQLQPSFKPTFIVLATVAILSQLNWALQFDFNDIIPRIILALLGSAFLTLLVAVFVLLYQGIIAFPKFSANLKFTNLGVGYKILFWILLAVSFYTQISWALQFYFDDIVLRLILAFIGSWVLPILLANLVDLIRKDSGFSLQNFKSQLKSKQLRIFFSAIAILAITTQLHWALHHNFDDIWIRLLGAVLVSGFISIFYVVFSIIFSRATNKSFALRLMYQSFLPLLFLALYFQLASLFYFTGVNMNLGLFALGFVVLSQIIGFSYFIKSKKLVNSYLYFIGFLALLTLFLSQVLIILFVGEGTEFTFPAWIPAWLINNDKIHSFTNLGIIFTSVSLPFYLRATETKLPSSQKSNFLPYSLAVLYFLGFIFLWNPLTIYSTYPDIFDFPAVEILKQNIDLFAISLGVLLALYFVLPSKLKRIWFVFVLSMVLISFVHNTIAPIKLGSLQGNKFLHQDNLALPLFYFFLEGSSFLCVFSALNWILKKKYLKQVSFFLLLLNLILISQGFIESSRTGAFWTKPKLPADSSNSISFSKEKENVVFMIVDMFHGWYMNRILKDDPEIKELFEGFVWYPNTLSVSSITCSSIGSLLGGFDYTIDKLNQDEEHSMEEKVTKITEEFFNKIKSSGYNFTANKMIYSKIDKNLFDTFLPKWHDDWNQWNSELNIGNAREVGYTILWENAAFYSVPLILKPLIYNGGRWLHGDVEQNENTNQTKIYNFMRLLPFISNANSTKPNFIYLHSMASHHPWDVIDENGKIHFDVTPYENNQWTIETLGKWIAWMKDNDVYDNTKIVLLSDHGPHWRSSKNPIDMNLPLIENPDLKIKNEQIMEMFPLLLVKDFNRKSPLEIDWRFMSNADASSIAFGENDPTKVEPPLSRTLPATSVNWKRKIWLDTQVDIRHKFTVKDNVFDLRNWEEY